MMGQHAAWAEWKAGWPVVLAAAVGFGVVTVHYHSLGVMIRPLSDLFGWSRGQISAGLMIGSFGIMVLGPVFGNIADRIGARRMALLGICAYSAGLVAIGLSGPSIWTWYAAWTFMGVGQAMAAGTVWTMAIASRFERHRGLALALALSGTGLIAAFAPVLTFAVFEAHGWRAAYFVLAGGIIVFVLPLLWALFWDASDLARRDAKRVGGIAPSAAVVAKAGLTLAEALRTLRFWQMGLAFLIAALSISAMLIHFQPMLIDGGLPPASAAAIAAVIGPSLVFGRLIGGYLLDRVFAPLVAMVVFLIPTISCFLLFNYQGGWQDALIIGICLGAAAGAELDLIAYLTARYFGLKSYGAIYGILGGLFAVGAGLAPVLAGAAFDITGSYQTILLIFGMGLLTCATMIGLLGKYPSHEAQQPVPAQ
jgi:MFS family permease